MKNTARFSYLLIGIIFPILVGALHTFCHFTDLITINVQDLLNNTIPILGEEKLLYNAWGLMSFMMGVSFIIIGLLNLGIFQRMDKTDYPPVTALLAMMLYLAAVIYAGSQFQAFPQLYGSIFGIILTTIALGLTLVGRNK